jgi:hypothetical protein
MVLYDFFAVVQAVAGIGKIQSLHSQVLNASCILVLLAKVHSHGCVVPIDHGAPCLHIGQAGQRHRQVLELVDIVASSSMDSSLFVLSLVSPPCSG